jgi:uncharacterized RDD family membrane protein YckC
MQTVTVHTSQNIDIDYEVADLGDRVLARLIDMAIFISIIILTVILILMSSGYEAMNNTLGIVLIIVYASLYVFYDLACEVFMNGQSVGKRLRKIKVVSIDGAQPTIGQYLLRWLFRIVDFSLTSSLCALISVAVSDKKQRVGDMVAGTTLIKTEPRTQADQIAFNPIEEDYEPQYTQATQLSDRDIELIHEVIRTYLQTGNTMIVYNMAEKVKEHLGVPAREDINSLEFLEIILKDYNYLVAKQSDL